MKKFIIVAFMAFSAFAFSACNKDATQTINRVEEAKNESISDFELLRSEIINLNDSRLSPDTKIPRWLGWLGVGISDAVGGLVGAQVGGIFGGIVLGAIASIEAYIEFVDNQSTNAVGINGINDIDDAEDIFGQYSLQSGEFNDGLADGYYHNAIIRSLFDKHGDNLFLMDEDSLVLAIEAETVSLCGADVEETSQVMNTFNASDFVYNEAIDETPSAFINRIQAMNTGASLELSILEPVLAGVNGIEDRQERVEYVQDVVELVDDSQIPALSKRTIKSGATIALESSLLWNIE